MLKNFQAPLAGKKFAPHFGRHAVGQGDPEGTAQPQTFVSFNNLGGHHEISSASRPCCRQAHRCRREVAGGIIIPDTAKEKPSQGEVIAVGPGGRDEAGKLIPIDIKVGDRVLFGKWSGTEVKIDGQDS